MKQKNHKCSNNPTVQTFGFRSKILIDIQPVVKSNVHYVPLHYWSLVKLNLNDYLNLTFYS